MCIAVTKIKANPNILLDFLQDELGCIREQGYPLQCDNSQILYSLG